MRIPLGGPRGPEYYVNPLQATLDYSEIIKRQLALKGLHVPIWIDFAEGMRNIVAVERSHNLDKRAGLRNRLPRIRGEGATWAKQRG